MNNSDKLTAIKLPTLYLQSRKSISAATSQLSKNNNPSRTQRRVSYTLNKSSRQSQNGTYQFSDKPKQNGEQFVIGGNINIINQTETNQEIFCVCYTEPYDYIAVGLSNGAIEMMNINNGHFEFTLCDNEMVHNPGLTTAIKHRRVQTNWPIAQTLTATYATGYVKCWHYPTGRCLYTIREYRKVLGLSYHPHLTKFVTVGDDSVLNLYDEETRTQERTFHSSISSSGKVNGHKSCVLAACFYPKSNHELISGGWDETIQFWDTRQANATRQIVGGTICGDSLDMSTNGKEILACCWSKENSIRLWDYGSGKCITTIEPDIWTSNLYTGKYIGKFFIACGGCDENIFRIVDLRFHSTAAFIKNLSGGVYAMDIGQNSAHTKQRSSFTDIPQLPKLAFCCGKSIFEIEIN